MGTITGQEISDQVGVLLLDESADRWTEPERLDHLNEALREAARLKPDLSVATETVSLAAGTRQEIPANALSVADITRNTGTYSRPIIVIDRAVLDRNLGDWHSVTQNPEVSCFTFDDRNPTRFFVFPPNDGTGQVEADLYISPTALSALSETIPLDDTYAGAMVDYVAYKCMAKDSDDTAGASLAATHLQRFYQKIGITESVEFSTSPNNPSARHDGGS